MTEAELIAALKRLPLHPGAARLSDDAALVSGLIVTTDTLIEGVHFLPDDSPGDVAWKLVAQNLSDLAAKGASPEGLTLNYPLRDDGWDQGFILGLGEVLTAFACSLIGGDTVALPARAPRVISATAFGRPGARVPRRDGARAGDILWVTGTIGDAGVGLALAEAGRHDPAALLARYRRPTPRLAEGRTLAAQANAMMDVSDGLLIDAGRLAAASGVAVTIDLARVPLSPDLIAYAGGDRAARIAAATAGDDYELLAALRPGEVPAVAATAIGGFAHGAGLTLADGVERLALPARLGFVHNGL